MKRGKTIPCYKVVGHLRYIRSSSACPPDSSFHLLIGLLYVHLLPVLLSNNDCTMMLTMKHEGGGGVKVPHYFLIIPKKKVFLRGAGGLRNNRVRQWCGIAQFLTCLVVWHDHPGLQSKRVLFPVNLFNTAP
eukprot:1146381-Pelagomonas_calceolata.AAC.1